MHVVTFVIKTDAGLGQLLISSWHPTIFNNRTLEIKVSISGEIEREMQQALQKEG